MKVDNLNKVGLQIKFKSPASSAHDDWGTINVSFVYGAASAGISPLEQKIFQMEIGDSFQLMIPRSSAQEYFGPIYKSICQELSNTVAPDQFELQLSITSVSKAQEREIIQAMAQSLSHSCGGGSCDCGCS